MSRPSVKASTSPSTPSAPTTCNSPPGARSPRGSHPQLRFGHIPGNAPTVEGLQRKLEPLSFFADQFFSRLGPTPDSTNPPRFLRRRSEMTRTTAHFVFTAWGAGCLVQALRKAGLDDQVIASFDALSFGPINPADPSLRAKWVEN